MSEPRCRHVGAVARGALWFCPECARDFKSDPLDRYFTQPALAQRIVEWALRVPIPSNAQVLEPSAGSGEFVRALLATDPEVRVTAIEMGTEQMLTLHDLARQPEGFRLTVLGADFLAWRPASRHYLAVMNPPYSNPDGADGLHVAHALHSADRVVALVRANFIHGQGRWQQVFRWCRITRKVILSRRPPFSGPADKGHTARHDYQVLEMVRAPEQSKGGAHSICEVEFWDA